MPRNYEYVLPEDYTLKPETLEKINGLVEKYDLSNDCVQAFIDIHVELMEEFTDAMVTPGGGMVLTS